MLPEYQLPISVVNRQRYRSPERDRLSGFRLKFVGLFVGFLSLPDKYSPNGISGLHAICRVCRVLLGVESPQEIGASNSTDQ